MFALPSRCRGDVKAADETCQAVDEMAPLEYEKSGGNAVQRLSMLPNTAELKAYITPTVNNGAWCTQRIKKK